MQPQPADFCTNLYGDNETERCWLAYNYFEERKKASEEGCSLEVDCSCLAIASFAFYGLTCFCTASRQSTIFHIMPAR